MTPTFDITKCKRNEDGHLVAQYRNGEPAIILTTNRPVENYPIVSIRVNGNVEVHKPDGSWVDGEIHGLDLINIPEKKRTIEFWVNVYSNRAGGTSATKQDADKCSTPSRIACLHIVREYTEGEGL